MRKNTTGVSALGLLVLFTMIFGCNKDKGKIESKLTAATEAKLAILKLGLDTTHVVDMGTYYLVGGDIGVKKSRLNAALPRQVYYNANPFVSQSLQGVLTVRINDDVPSDGSNYDYRAAIPLAIQEWNNAGSGIHFTLVNTPTADITIHCQAVNDPKLYAFIDDWPVNGSPSHYISINTLCTYGNTTFTNEQKKWIMVHELGHAVNIAHTQDYTQSYATKIGNSPDIDSNSVFTGGRAGDYTGFTSWDLYAIKFLYPASTFTFGRVDYPAPPGVSVSGMSPVTVQFLQNSAVVRTVTIPLTGNISEAITPGTYNLKFIIPSVSYPVYFYVRSTNAPYNIEYWYRLSNTNTYTTPTLTFSGGSTIGIDLTNDAL